uniref:Glyceraldehyde-3-phosphate dehydrogenase, chloroplastic n=1 Tax=Chondrus crispus TaxID=2769 RepID=G3PA_CHOCR|nr:RecName: Full=Glyceraldehyde-3-phosphate dehydrogenase, chloroplastic; AltName: Full=NADP-dependent glyceraldehydephosphate dehydrogenase; Flags: Precursor [Chondrus crispus]CAA51516.1 glyceraldehyde-3-phosphate dehydrogenase (NADP+) (phosphorylating) precursor [Chondrus crispus]
MAFVAPVATVRATTKSSVCQVQGRSTFAQFSGMKKVNQSSRLQPAQSGSAFGGYSDANDAFYTRVSGIVAATFGPTMKVRVAINGFGRIGRNFIRCWAGRSDSNMEVVCINDTSGVKTASHLLKYDSILGTFDADVSAGEDTISVNGKTIKIVSNRNPLQLPWKEMNIDIVVEATGVFVDAPGAGKHIEAGAKKVLITAPGKGDGIGTFVVGVNEKDYSHDKYDIVSNASCTTNCMAPFMKVLDDEFGVVRGMMTTTHSYTGDQRLLDAGHRDLRRARSAALNIVPTTTGAAKAVALVVPSLKGKLNGIALRVPTPNVSVCDVVMQVNKKTFKEEVNGALLKASEGAMKGIIKYSDEPLVSCDHRGTDESTIIDSSLTMVMGDDMIKVVAWYDNEWGYSQRVVDLGEVMARQWK